MVDIMLTADSKMFQALEKSIFWPNLVRGASLRSRRHSRSQKSAKKNWKMRKGKRQWREKNACEEKRKYAQILDIQYIVPHLSTYLYTFLVFIFDISYFLYLAGRKIWPKKWGDPFYF